jgi:cytochrome oxidase Cu insertion factor (SCO1/SenC/PrrC family)
LVTRPLAVTIAELETRTTPTARRTEDPLPVEEGSPAPDFTLTSDTGDAIALSSLQGSPVVLYFYPKDDTPATI